MSTSLRNLLRLCAFFAAACACAAQPILQATSFMRWALLSPDSATALARLGAFGTNVAYASIDALVSTNFYTGTLRAGDIVLTNGAGIPGLPYDLTWAGAIADDGLDDSAELQTAINNANMLGRYVRVPEGVFDYGAGSYTINVTSNTVIVGNGPRSVLRHYGRGSGTALFTITTGTNLVLKNLKLANARFGVTLPAAYYPTLASYRPLNILLEDIWTEDLNSVLWCSGDTATFRDYDFVDSVIVRRMRYTADIYDNANNYAAILWDRAPTHYFLVEDSTMHGGHTFIYNRYDDAPKNAASNPTLKYGIAVIRGNTIAETGSYVYNHQGIELHGNKALIENNLFKYGGKLAGYTPTLALVDGGTGYANGTAYVDGVNNSNVVLTLQTSAGVVTNFTVGSTTYCPTNALAYTNIYMIVQGANTNATVNLSAFTLKNLEDDAIYLYGSEATVRNNRFDRWGNVVTKPQTITCKGASLVVNPFDTNTIQSSVNYNHAPGWGVLVVENTFQDDPTNSVRCGQIGFDVDGALVRGNKFLDFSDAAATHIVRVAGSTGATYNELGFMFVEENWFMRCKPAAYVTYSPDAAYSFANVRYVGNRTLFDKRTSGTGYGFDSAFMLKNLIYSDNIFWACPYVTPFRASLSTSNRWVSSAIFERNYFTNISDGILFTGASTGGNGQLTNVISRFNTFDGVNRAHYFQQYMDIVGARVGEGNLYINTTKSIETLGTGMYARNFQYMSNGIWYLTGTTLATEATLSAPFYGITMTTPTNNLIPGGWFISNAVYHVYDGTNFVAP